MFPITEIGHWAKEYPEHDNDDAFEAGRKIRQGECGRTNLEAIVRWKSPRRIQLIANNSDSEIADALHLALRVNEPRSAFGC
jgi:hypothetical protein